MMAPQSKRDRAGGRGRHAATILAAVALWLAAALPAFPAEPPAPPAAGTATAAAAAPDTAHKPSDAITHHAIKVGDKSLRYSATAGIMEIDSKDKKARGEIFFTAYTRDDQQPEGRPITFVFNGGPGASSAYLHLLALGPRLMQLGDDGTILPPPARLADNPETWLAFTDLVFIDPVGTGYSQATPTAQADRNGEESADRQFWNAEADMDVLAEFIRRSLARLHRWESPKFLVGESYGGFRAAALTKRLAQSPGVRLNGIVLISPVLEFGMLQFGRYRLQPWVSILPAYAATARHYGKPAPDGDPAKLQAEAETFARGDYLTWLAGGGTLDDDAMFDRLAHYLGLPRALVERTRGRVPRVLFAKTLLSGSGRLVSLYDSTISATDPNPQVQDRIGDDPVLDGLTAPLATAFNSYIGSELDFDTQRPYIVLNPDVGRRWSWGSGSRARPRAPGTAGDLKDAMSLNPDLSVLIVHGRYDLVTPYFASSLVVSQMQLDTALARHLTFETYDGGHMPYTHRAARAAFYRDAENFFRQAVAGPVD